MSAVQILEGQRRQVTVLFTDVVDSTRIIDRLGEEAGFLLMRQVFVGSVEIVRRNGGIVPEFTGDGIMALFGVPATVEDAPLRACRTAFQIHEWVDGFAAQSKLASDLCPRLRIGIHSGPVVTGNIGTGERAEFTAIGDTVNLASRLLDVAAPGETAVSQATKNLIGSFLELDDLGARPIKGKAEPQRVYRLRGIVGDMTRFAARSRRGLAVFVGREAEMAALEACLADLRRGRSLVAEIVGEPGIGKSRILYELAQHRAAKGCQWLQGHCVTDGQSIPFHPFVEIIRKIFAISPRSGAVEVTARLRAGLSSRRLDPERHLPYFLHLLGQGSLPEHIQDEQVGVQLRASLQALLLGIIGTTPTVLAIEDMHWIDRASESFLLAMLEGALASPVLILCTYRPSYRAAWVDRPNGRRIHLAPLSRASTMSLMRNCSGGQPIADECLTLLADRVEGNPLFAEEMVSYLIEWGGWEAPTGPPGARTIELMAGVPSEIEALLMQRIDRLADSPKQMIKLAAVIGRWFDRDLLKSSLTNLAALAVRVRAGRGSGGDWPGESPAFIDLQLPVDGAAADLDRDLASLADQELIFAEADGLGHRYRFKHALVQEVVYNTVPRSNRELMHSAVAESLEQASRDETDEVADLLVHHYSRTNNYKKTLQYLVQAGRNSLRIYSIDEAYDRLTAALELAKRQTGQISEVFLADLVLNVARINFFRCDVKTVIEILEAFLPRVAACGDARRLSNHLSELGHAYIYAARPRKAAPTLSRALALASELGDDDAIGRAMLGQLWNCVFFEPPLHEQRDRVQRLGHETVRAGRRARNTWVMVTAVFALAQDAVAHANPRAIRHHVCLLENLYQETQDLRAKSLGLVALAELDALYGNYDRAIKQADAALPMLLTPIDRRNIECVKGIAAAMTGRAEEASRILGAVRADLVSKELNLACLLIDEAFGVAKFANGDMAGGVRWIEQAVQRLTGWGFAMAAANGHSFLGEIYTRIALGYEKVSWPILVKNIWFILRTKPFASRIARRHLETAIRDYRTYDAPAYTAWALLDLGLLDNAVGRTKSADLRLLEARRTAECVDADALIERIDRALAGLSGR